MKPKIVEFKRTAIPQNVRDAVIKALDENYPFIMIAKRPNGEWENSCHYRVREVSDDEVIGALQRVAHRIMVDEMDDEDHEKGAS